MGKKARHTFPDRASSPPVNLFPHQEEGVKFLRRNFEANHASYLAADPGLGKTRVAVEFAKEENLSVIYVCPPFLLENVKAEFRRWGFKGKLLVIPDSLIARPLTLLAVKEFLDQNFFNPFLVVDEAHRFKNPKAKRTKALLKTIAPLFGPSVVYLSGTPMPKSQPQELWPILQASAPNVFGRSFMNYAFKYCGAYKTDFGWRFDRFINRPEFKARLFKQFMLRQKKELLKLPPKREALMLFESDKETAQIEKLEAQILKAYPKDEFINDEVLSLAGRPDADIHVATYLKFLGKYKLKMAVPFLEDLLTETKESILVFALHRDVIAGLERGLKAFKPFVITGDTPKALRQKYVDQFQKDPLRRLFIGNIHACGLGFTLTKATRAVFVEFSTVDGVNVQASDRIHRISQTESVLVQYIALAGTLDAGRIETLLKRRKNSL